MSNSLSEWLALREAADWTARSERLVERARESLGGSNGVRALDLCTGSGSNLRYLLPRLPARQHWVVVDRDAGLLEEVPARLSGWAQTNGCEIENGNRVSRIRGDRIDCVVEARTMDLNQLDEKLFEGRNLVTASALLDLVSESWLHMLASRCRTAGATALFSITYDGRSSCDPVEPEDGFVRELMNQHQLTEKGLGGPAAGPLAAAAAERIFEEAGYHVELAASDWSIGPADRAFQRMLIDGWAEAAGEMAPQHESTIADWLERRRRHVDAGRSRIVVGHHDMAAWIAG